MLQGLDRLASRSIGEPAPSLITQEVVAVHVVGSSFDPGRIEQKNDVAPGPSENDPEPGPRPVAEYREGPVVEPSRSPARGDAVEAAPDAPLGNAGGSTVPSAPWTRESSRRSARCWSRVSICGEVVPDAMSPRTSGKTQLVGVRLHRVVGGDSDRFGTALRQSVGRWPRSVMTRRAPRLQCLRGTLRPARREIPEADLSGWAVRTDARVAPSGLNVN